MVLTGVFSQTEVQIRLGRKFHPIDGSIQDIDFFSRPTNEQIADSKCAFRCRQVFSAALKSLPTVRELLGVYYEEPKNPSTYPQYRATGPGRRIQS
jgi:hypothetical protein